MEFPVVVLHGARQTGKSTLIQMTAVGAGRTYRTLDDNRILEVARRDPKALVAGNDPLTIDEVQRAPQLLLAVKEQVDRRRAPGRYLLRGSANLLPMKRVADALPGRAVCVRLDPMTAAGLSAATTSRYLAILETSFQVLRVPAYTPNRGKRLIRSPKLYWSDTGLASHLAEDPEPEALQRSPEWGFRLESLVAAHLATYAELAAQRLSMAHWRSSDGSEVDFILESARSLLPVEVKATPRPSARHVRGLELFLDLHPEARFGVVACPCREPMLLWSRIAVLPIAALLVA